MNCSRLLISAIVMVVLPLLSFGRNECDGFLRHSLTVVEDTICGSEDKEKPMAFPEVLPEFSGGESKILSFVTQRLKLPQETLDAGITSTKIVVSFIVEKDGSVSDFKVTHSIEKHLDEAVVSVLRMMPKWKPGEHKGKKVRTEVSLPICLDFR